MERRPRTIGEIADAPHTETDWSRTTVFVMLKRLIAKGAVRMDDSGRLEEYYPLIGRRDVTSGETASFLARVYDGSIGDGLLHDRSSRCADKTQDCCHGTAVLLFAARTFFRRFTRMLLTFRKNGV